MIFLDKPDGFNPQFEVVSCLLHKGDSLLLLHRKDCKPQGNTWGIPAAKVGLNEGIVPAILRAINEQTGFQANPDKLFYFRPVYVRYPEFDFVDHIFSTSIHGELEVELDETTYKDFQWVRPFEALNMDLLQDIGETIELFYSDREYEESLSFERAV